MEESRSNQGKKKISIKIGGGGIGAVVLLGGALATAALASAFVFRKNRRSSGKDRRHQNPPPGIDKQKEQDEADKAQQFVLLDQPSHVNKKPSSGAIKQVESDDDDTAFMVSNQTSALDEKSRPDKICDIGSIEQIPCSISPNIPETDAIFDAHAVVIAENFPSMDEKLQIEPQKMMHGDEIATHLTKGDAYNEMPKENQKPEQVHFVKERAESEHYQEDIKVILVDRNETEKNVHTEVDMEKNELEDVLESRVTEYGNVKGRENEFVGEREKRDPPDEMIVVEKCEDQIDVMKEDKISCDIKEENACRVYPTQENMQFGFEMFKEDDTKDGENDLEGDINIEVDGSSKASAASKDDSTKENSVDEEDKNLTKGLHDGTVLSDVVHLIDSEGDRTIGEDSSVVTNQVKPEIEKGNDTEKTLIMKYVAELAMSNDQYLTDSTGRKIIIIAMLYVVSSLSCSWFFGLSFVELCLVVFLTMVLSSWLLHSRHEIGKHMCYFVYNNNNNNITPVPLRLPIEMRVRGVGCTQPFPCITNTEKLFPNDPNENCIENCIL